MSILKSKICLLGILFFSLVAWGQQPFGLVIHGGAGTIRKENMTPEREQMYREALQKALDTGYDVLKTGGSSLDAVETVIRFLENSPLFNAGKGAVYTWDETHELDASIMDGKTLNAGAVAGVSHVKNPISLARKVMEDSPHVLLSGHGAEEFAKQEKVEIVDSSYFDTEARLKSLKKYKERATKPNKRGTVGVVALDLNGNLAAGTSTGGMTGKRYGRIGDSPIIGAGTYANNQGCAVSCTGHGEFFIRKVVAYEVFALMHYANQPLEKAAEQVVNQELKAMGAEGGLIAIDKDANPVMKFNTPGMYRGFKTSKGKEAVFLYSEDKP